jgi:hypothetical protein
LELTSTELFELKPSQVKSDKKLGAA